MFPDRFRVLFSLSHFFFSSFRSRFSRPTRCRGKKRREKKRGRVYVGESRRGEGIKSREKDGRSFRRRRLVPEEQSLFASTRAVVAVAAPRWRRLITRERSSRARACQIFQSSASVRRFTEKRFRYILIPTVRWRAFARLLLRRKKHGERLDEATSRRAAGKNELGILTEVFTTFSRNSYSATYVQRRVQMNNCKKRIHSVSLSNMKLLPW